MGSERRKRKLIMPELQLPFAGVLVASALMILAASSSLLFYTLANLASEMPNDGPLILLRLPEILIANAFFTLILICPALYWLSLVFTHRMVGPFYRFKMFLTGIRDEAASEPCRIRRTDRLHDFCDLLNDVTESVRAKNSQMAPSKIVEASPEHTTTAAVPK